MVCIVRQVAIAALLVLGSTANAEPEPTEKSQRWVRAGFNWMEAQRNFLSKRVTQTAEVMDDYLARDSFEATDVNESYLRIQLSNGLSTGFDEDFGARISGRLQLPGLVDRWHLFLESAPDEFRSIDERQQGASDNLSARSTVLGVSLWRNVDRYWNPSLSVGANIDPFQLVTKLRFRRHFPITDTWQSRASQAFSYRNSRGWVSDTRFDVYRPLPNDAIFRASTEAQFNQQVEEPIVSTSGTSYPEHDYIEFFHGWYYARQLSTEHSIQYSVAATALNKPRRRFEKAWLRADWRTLLYEDWLFLKISPEVSFPRERNFKDTWGIYVELEIYAGENFNAVDETRLVP
jgi:hypothetical protein